LHSHPEVNVLVSDDGLQHYALQRDIEIVLFDSRGIGNGWPLPAGPLRESTCRRRDFTVVNAPVAVDGMPPEAIRMQLAGTVAYRLGDQSRTIALAALSRPLPEGAGTPHIVAAAGIGNPSRFFTMLRDAGLMIEEMPLPDHYDFSGNPFTSIKADIILITEKDAVKCRRIDTLKNDARLWVVPVTAQLDGVLLEQLLEKLRGFSTA
jgi:tetraacyldisaccharide 4'-kinase